VEEVCKVGVGTVIKFALSDRLLKSIVGPFTLLLLFPEQTTFNGIPLCTNTAI